MVNLLKYYLITKFLLVLIFFHPVSSFSQQSNDEAFLTSVGIGGVFSGIGAMINKQPDQTSGQAFLNGFLKGGAGGVLIYSSKRMIGEFSNSGEWEYAWSGKVINGLGNSIIENASYNRPALEKLHLNVGFIRLEANLSDEINLQPKVMPLSFFKTIQYVGEGSKFDFENTLKTGEFFFTLEEDKRFFDERGVAVSGYGNNVVLNNYRNNYTLMGHEIIHVYQNNDFNVLNSYYQKIINNYSREDSKILKWVYVDGHRLLYSLSYSIEGTDGCIFDNYFEHEAGYYTNTITCD